MVVDDAVAATIRGQSQAQVATFVASCAERMAQVFTGLSGDDPARNGDADVVIRLVEDLWNPAISAAAFRDYVTSLEGFQELEPSDEEIVDVAGIYSFYSVLVLRYAALYRSSADVEDALKCAHASLTAMGQLDRNLRGAEFFAQEAELQQHVSSLGDRGADPVQRLRDGDRAVSQQRLVAIQGRLTR
ncbi:hypothetical protein ACFZCL_18045 [Streptomyces sp. NPDC008159]|uniref:hypothetical protein n=1 Tax=Streptomyces sp. NPDC008159 TaxID=3364817 RepID=UPI0036EE04AA